MVIGKEKYLTVEITKTGTKKVQFLSIKYEEVSAKISDILKKSHMINEIFQPHGSLYQLRKHPSKTDLGFHGWYRIEFCCPGLMAVVYNSDLCSTFRRHLQECSSHRSVVDITFKRNKTASLTDHLTVGRTTPEEAVTRWRRKEFYLALESMSAPYSPGPSSLVAISHSVTAVLVSLFL